MLYLTCTTITSVDFAHYGVYRAKDWVSVDCGTKYLSEAKILLDCICIVSKGLKTGIEDSKDLFQF